MLVAGLLAFSTAAGQSAGEVSSIRYGVYVNPATTTLGPGGSVGLFAETDRHVFSLRAATTDLTFGDDTWDVGVLYGRALLVRAFTFSAGTGVSVVGGRRYPSLFGRGSGRNLEPMIGFPLEGAVTWTAARVFSLGVRAFGNINTGQPFGGLGVTVHVGRMQ